MDYAILKILHLVSSALWLGAALWVPRDVKSALAVQRPDAALGARIRPALRLDAWAGVATLLTGLALTLALGTHRVGIGIGIAITVVLLLLVMLVLLPLGKRIASIVESGGDLGEARRLARQLSAFAGVRHLLWLAALVVMVLPY
jgi:hypothetical protein